MPELPEVETSLRGIQPYIDQQELIQVEVRQAKLRWPIDVTLLTSLVGQRIINMQRRAKYMLLTFESGHVVLIHLGMSGSVRIIQQPTTPNKHDHWDLHFANGVVLRYHDPRRFGALEIYHQDDEHNKQLDHLGPEPLSEEFTCHHLFTHSRKKKLAVKQYLMDNKIVVGVGNIYANEALFIAKIRPDRPANDVSEAEYQVLTQAIKDILAKAIASGGTTLRDFVGGDGKPGYFAQSLFVYGRKGEQCLSCATPLVELRQGGRSSMFCPSCQH